MSERQTGEDAAAFLGELKSRGYVIAPASQVVTPELRTALGKVLLDVKFAHSYWPGSMSWESDHEDIAAIERWLEVAG